MIVAMAGLPGTGKSTLAKKLTEDLPAIMLNKDSIRAALFPPNEIEYSSRQDDFVVDVMLEVADYYLQKDASRIIILDGRTFSKTVQVNTLVEFSQKKKCDLKVIYCTCPDEVVRERLERDVASGEHLAADRDFNLYLKLKAQSDPLQVPYLHVDTGNSLEFCTMQCLAYLREHSENQPKEERIK